MRFLSRNQTAAAPPSRPQAATETIQTSRKQGVKSYRMELIGPQPSLSLHNGGYFTKSWLSGGALPIRSCCSFSNRISRLQPHPLNQVVADGGVWGCTGSDSRRSTVGSKMLLLRPVLRAM